MILLFIDKEERKTNKENANLERRLSKTALFFYSHLPFNMQLGYFLLENIQSEYAIFLNLDF